MIDYEIRYLIRCDDVVHFLGFSGGSKSEEKLMNMVIGQNDTLLYKFSNEYYHFLSHNQDIRIENGASITLTFEYSSREELLINLWLACSPPKKHVSYMGLNPENKVIKCNLRAHCWDMYPGAIIVHNIENLTYILEFFRKLEPIVPDHHIIRFMMYCDKVRDPLLSLMFDDKPPSSSIVQHSLDSMYIYGYFFPVEKITIDLDNLNSANENEYKLEICTLERGYYYSILKDKYHSKKTIKIANIRSL